MRDPSISYKRGGRRPGAGRPRLGVEKVGRTYYLPKTMLDRINALADDAGIGPSELCTKLLVVGLEVLYPD